MVDLTDPIFQNADKARRFLEQTRWADGAYCPHCGSLTVKKMAGKKHRKGAYQCNDCRRQFSVTVGTIFERSKVPLNKWLAAFFLLNASKKGVSAHQIHRMLGVTYKTAWFMMHRIREAMSDDSADPFGGTDKNVEIDETFIGSKKAEPKPDEFVSGIGWFHAQKPRGYGHKYAIMSLVERGGRARSFHVTNVTAKTLRPIIMRNVDRASRLQTDETSYYVKLGREFKGGHGQVKHGMGQYVKGDDHTNTIEGFFSIFKRGMKGIYQHCGEQHLQRYLNEFDFRYSRRDITDWERTTAAIKGAEGKRLTYRRTGDGANV